MRLRCCRPNRSRPTPDPGRQPHRARSLALTLSLPLSLPLALTLPLTPTATQALCTASPVTRRRTSSRLPPSRPPSSARSRARVPSRRRRPCRQAAQATAPSGGVRVRPPSTRAASSVSCLAAWSMLPRQSSRRADHTTTYMSRRADASSSPPSLFTTTEPTPTGASGRAAPRRSEALRSVEALRPGAGRHIA